VRRSGCIVSEIREDGSVWIGVQLRRDEDPMLGHLLDGVAQSARLGTVGLDYFHTTLWFVPDSIRERQQRSSKRLLRTTSTK
jgi:hypothetical protein